MDQCWPIDQLNGWTKKKKIKLIFSFCSKFTIAIWASQWNERKGKGGKQRVSKSFAKQANGRGTMNRAHTCAKYSSHTHTHQILRIMSVLCIVIVMLFFLNCHWGQLNSGAKLCGGNTTRQCTEHNRYNDERAFFTRIDLNWFVRVAIFFSSHIICAYTVYTHTCIHDMFWFHAVSPFLRHE